MFCLCRGRGIEADYYMGFESRESYGQIIGAVITQNQRYTFYLRILLFFAWSHRPCRHMLCLQIRVFQQS